MMNFSIIEPLDGFVGVGAPMKDNDWRGRFFWFEKEVEGKEGAAVAFEAGGPVFWEEDHVRPDTVSEVRLGRRKIGEGVIFFLEILFVDKSLFVGKKTKDGRVTYFGALAGNPAETTNPIVNDGDFVGFKCQEGINRPSENDVEVQKERRSRNREPRLKEAELSPSRLDLGFGNIDFRNRVALNLWIEPLSIIGKANEPKGEREVFGNCVVEPVGVFGTIALSPFECDNIVLQFRHLGSKCVSSTAESQQSSFASES